MTAQMPHAAWVAAHAVEYETNLDRARALRAADRTMQDVSWRMRASLATGRRYAENVARSIRATRAYLDSTLIEQAASDLPGIARQAEILLTVPHEHRADVVREANLFRNMTPSAGRWSDALRTCAHRYPRLEAAS